MLSFSKHFKILLERKSFVENYILFSDIVDEIIKSFQNSDRLYSGHEVAVEFNGNKIVTKFVKKITNPIKKLFKCGDGYSCDLDELTAFYSSEQEKVYVIIDNIFKNTDPNESYSFNELKSYIPNELLEILHHEFSHAEEDLHEIVEPLDSKSQNKKTDTESLLDYYDVTTRLYKKVDKNKTDSAMDYDSYYNAESEVNSVIQEFLRKYIKSVDYTSHQIHHNHDIKRTMNYVQRDIIDDARYINRNSYNRKRILKTIYTSIEYYILLLKNSNEETEQEKLNKILSLLK